MKTVSSPDVDSVDLLDLKLLPAWVKEGAESARYASSISEERTREPRHGRARLNKRSSFKRIRVQTRAVGTSDHLARDERRRVPPKPLQVSIRFLPQPPAFENVSGQIKAGLVAYSLLALARLFLQKPQRYEVSLSATGERPLFQLSENGALSFDREFLERNAFRFARESFYRIEITQSEPIHGNFSNVARCRLTGTLLGPTNHHTYQAKLRSLYEQRFSRRMSFADYQRQIEIVNDPALVQRWKDEARNVTTYTTLREDSPVTFSAAAEAERHFRANYLTDLIRPLEQITIDGISSRRLADQTLRRAIEDAWAREMKSPSKIMEELAARFREAGLNLFRHRRGALFVSPIRPHPFTDEQGRLSSTVNAILEVLRATPAINRKELFEKLNQRSVSENAESWKLSVASDLRWLISAGYIIEFNDGLLDLPRSARKPQEIVAADTRTAEPTTSSPEMADLEIGGS